MKTESTDASAGGEHSPQETPAKSRVGHLTIRQPTAENPTKVEVSGISVELRTELRVETPFGGHVDLTIREARELKDWLVRFFDAQPQPTVRQ